VDDSAQVYGKANIQGRAKIGGGAQIYDSATVGDTACVFGYARVYDLAFVYGDASVRGRAEVCGYSKLAAGDLTGNARASIHPLVISGPRYAITICDNYVIAGCQCRTLKEWEHFGSEWPGQEDVDLWRQTLPVLKPIVEYHQSRVDKQERV
jgi:hypothetical protein